jgi:SAM-dependent methyltransferase
LLPPGLTWGFFFAADLPHSPAADRNKEPILERLKGLLGESGTALEIASGTGQHAVWFAASLANWTWQPTDPDPRDADRDRRASRAVGAGQCVLPPQQLDVTAPRWPLGTRKFDAIFCANMLHIAPWEACPGLMAGAARHLVPGGMLITYGPYFEAGVAPAPGNLAFDEDLRARNPAWGIRQLDDVVAQARREGLVLAQRHAMPANNLLLVFTAPSRWFAAARTPVEVARTRVAAARRRAAAR